MKRKILFFGSVLTFALCMPMFGQSATENLAAADIARKDSSEMAPKPTFEATTAGINMKVWVTASESEMKEHDMTSAQATKTEATAESYHVMVELKNSENGKAVKDATASLMTVSPTSKNATLELKPMANQLGGNLTLNEKGEYLFTVNTNVGGVKNATPFKFTVQ
jgi:hypothetical protein